MKICIDTNIYSELKRGNKKIISILESVDEVNVSTVALGELHAGFSQGKREEQNKKELDLFLSKPGIFVDDITPAISERYGHLIKLLKGQGTPIPTNDIWISASAMESGCRMLTLDNHFKKIPGLLLVSIQGLF